MHPSNRGGLGLNPHNVHRNLRIIAKVGGDGSKLVGATAFELSGNKKTRQMQVAFNRNLIQQARGLLAPPTGHERFASVATGHVTAGCRAVHAKCKSPAIQLCDRSDKRLSYEICSRNDPVVKEMLDKGWTFRCIPWQVEARWPVLPAIAEKALNSGNNVASLQSELEIASTIAETSLQTDESLTEDRWELCIEQAASSCPPCEEYIPMIGRYVRYFGGGDGAPIICFLDYIAKEFGQNKILGQEFWEALAYLSIPSDSTTYPMVRASMLALNLSSSKVVDGFARFINSGHIESLKKKAWKPKIDAVEAELQKAWDHTLELIAADKVEIDEGYRLLGALFARAAMFILDLGKKGFEAKDYENINEIVVLFTNGLQKKPTAAAGTASSSLAPARSGSATDSGQNSVSLQQSSDPKYIASTRGFALDLHYVMKSAPGRIFKLFDMTETHVMFSEHVVPEPSSSEYKVDYANLKNWTVYKGQLPQTLPQPISDIGSGNPRIRKEIERCDIFKAVAALAEQHKESENRVCYSLFPHIIQASEDVPKGKLTLVPWTESVAKVVDKSSVSSASVSYGGSLFHLEPPTRPSVVKQSEWAKNAMLAGFWWVATTTEMANVNLGEKLSHMRVSRFQCL